MLVSEETNQIGQYQNIEQIKRYLEQYVTQNERQRSQEKPAVAEKPRTSREEVVGSRNNLLNSKNTESFRQLQLQLNQQQTTAQAVRMSMETAQFKALSSLGRAPSYVQLNMVPSASSLLKQKESSQKRLS